MTVLPATYTNLADPELLELLATHDEFAFMAIYQRYAGVLYRAAYNRLPVVHKAEDLVQEVFISLYRKRNGPGKILHLKAWLFTCLRNSILNEIRNFNTHRRHDSMVAAHAPAVAINDTVYDLKLLEAQFHQALAQLTERCRQVFLLSRVENLSNKKIAEQLNISVPAVEKHVTTALRVMRKELGNHELGIGILLSVLLHS